MKKNNLVIIALFVAIVSAERSFGQEPGYMEMAKRWISSQYSKIGMPDWVKDRISGLDRSHLLKLAGVIATIVGTKYLVDYLQGGVALTEVEQAQVNQLVQEIKNKIKDKIISVKDANKYGVFYFSFNEYVDLAYDNKINTAAVNRVLNEFFLENNAQRFRKYSVTEEDIEKIRLKAAGKPIPYTEPTAIQRLINRVFGGGSSI